METFARFYLATVLAAFSLAPGVGVTCPAHKTEAKAAVKKTTVATTAPKVEAKKAIKTAAK